MSKRKEIQAEVETIEKSTGIKARSYRIINSGMENLVVDVNDAWIFRFPRTSIFRDNAKQRLRFLASFSNVSPLKIANPEYITDSFVGYKKISGKPFRPANLKKLTAQEKTKIAKQVGLFLRVLHGHKDKRINFDTGYLVMRRKDYKTCPPAIAKYLTSDEQKAFRAKLETIGRNPLNFRKPKSIIHGDLNFNNILWDSKSPLEDQMFESYYGLPFVVWFGILMCVSWVLCFMVAQYPRSLFFRRAFYASVMVSGLSFVVLLVLAYRTVERGYL